jgi:hypothetical protein
VIVVIHGLREYLDLPYRRLLDVLHEMHEIVERLKIMPTELTLCMLWQFNWSHQLRERNCLIRCSIGGCVLKTWRWRRRLWLSRTCRCAHGSDTTPNAAAGQSI